MDLRAQKRRSFLSQPYGASSVSLQRSLTQHSSLEAESLGPARAQSIRSLHSSISVARSKPDMTVKVVCVGDGACGKTSLLTRYVRGGFPEAYVPTVFENDVKPVQCFGLSIEMSLWDTAGQEDYDRLRAISYPETNVFVVCFSIDSPISLLNVKDKWIPEIRFYCPNIPFVLAGLKSDLRRTLGSGLVSAADARDAANEWGAVAYVESSARLNVNVDRVFEESVAAVLSPLRKKPDTPSPAPLHESPEQEAESKPASKRRDSGGQSRAGSRFRPPLSLRMFSSPDAPPPPPSDPGQPRRERAKSRCIIA